MPKGKDTRNHPNRRVDVANAYALLQAAHQDMSPVAHTMHETDAMFNSKYANVARDMSQHPETIMSRVTLAKGGIII
jgi:hypothetical protein